MALDLQSLDEVTRTHMRSELEADIADDTLYRSTRLSTVGRGAYADVVRDAIADGDDDDLATQLAKQGVMNATEPRQTKNGIKMVKVPVTAASTLAQGEFNRFYIRGLCLRVIESGAETVEVYRARASSQARPESEQLIGKRISAAELLEDLRSHKGEEPTLLPYVNSGLSVRE